MSLVNSRPVLSVLPVLFALGLSACGDDSAGHGTLIVPFELGNRRACTELGIQHIRGELDEGFLVEEADCEDGELRFELVPEDVYRLRVFGLDRDGFATMDSFEAGEVAVRTVGDGATVEVDPPLQLTAAPARLFLRWEFGFSSCEAAGVEHFEIMAWRADGSRLLLETTLDCALPGDGTDHYREVTDLMRELDGDEIGEVSVLAIAPDGRAVGEPVSFVFDAPGAGRPVELSLACSPVGCEGSGDPD